MDLPMKFACKVVHPALSYSFLLGLNAPLKYELIMEINKEYLTFESSSLGKTRELLRENIKNLENGILRRVTTVEQRNEILKYSLIRMGMWGILFFIFNILRSVGIGYALMISIPGAFVGGLFHFILNGGFSKRGDFSRFVFKIIEQKKPFFLEVEPDREGEVQQALTSAGLKIQEEEKKVKEEWECDECGATVDEDAVKCPYCGADFDGEVEPKE